MHGCVSGDVLPVDAGVVAFVTLVGFAAHMVEHVLLEEAESQALG